MLNLPRNIFSLAVLLFFDLLMFANELNAAELQHRIIASQGLEYANNPGLVANGGGSVKSLIFTPVYKASMQDGLNLYRLNAKIFIRRTDDDDISTNREDPSVDLSWLRDLPRGSLLLDTHWDRTASRETEFDDSGRVFRDGSRVNKRLGATWTYGITNRATLTLGGNYTDVDYQGVDLIAFSSKSVNSSVAYANNEKLTTILSLSYFDQDRDNGESSAAKSASLGFNYTQSSRLAVNAAFGLRKTDGSVVSGSGETYNLGMNYLLERGSISGTMSRSVSPSGGSSLIETDRYRAAFSYAISDNWQLSSSISLNENKTVNEVKLRQLDLSVSRAFNEAWSTRIYLTARERVSTDNTADSQTVGISLIYNSKEF